MQTGTAPARTFDLLIGRLPLVLGVKPETGPVGQIVAIRGRGFAADRHGNAVTFAGQPALVVSASPTELKAVVPPAPPGDIQPELAVVVTAGGRTSSSGTSFQLTRGATSGFRPRFFAAPVTEYPGDDLAFVSTELGPVLLLAGRAGGPSAAERSLAAAAALNTVVEAAPGRPAAFELRERPEPGVAVPGGPQLLVAATAEDAAAYARPWETGKGAGRHVSASALARHWTALLQDYLGLFLERQRPIQFVAQSPHARVLSDIYAEASRRSPGERTVPTSVVLPTPPAMAASLRLMALVVSTEAPRAAVAVEGRWQGRIEDPDHGGQAFQVQLGYDSGRLSGAITHRGGLDRGAHAAARDRVRAGQPALHRRPAGRAQPVQGHARPQQRGRHGGADGPEGPAVRDAVRGVSVARRVRSGLERLLDRPGPVRGVRAGLVCNPSTVTPDLVHGSVALARRARSAARRAVRSGARDRRRRAGPGGGRPLARPRDGPAGVQPLRRDARAHGGDAARRRRCCCSTSRTSARATTPSSTRCCT